MSAAAPMTADFDFRPACPEDLEELHALIESAYRGDSAAVVRFLNRPHQLLNGRTPLAMAQSSSAGAEAVINLVRRADAGFAV